MQPHPATASYPRRHFFTLDALRFLACMMVFIRHLPIGIPDWWQSGNIGVSFFFVLSGFLITYIILEEKAQTGRFRLGNFYIRRILRIWPLYFLMAGLAYSLPLISSLLHNSTPYHYEKGWMLFTFLENYKDVYNIGGLGSPTHGIVWSVCIEEHFYLLWGLLFFIIPTRRLPWLFGILIGIGWASKIYYGGIRLEILSYIDLFAWGAIPAWFLAQRTTTTEAWLGSKKPFWKQWYALAVIFLTLAACSQTHWVPVSISIPILGPIYALLLAFCAQQSPAIKIKDGSLLSRLGKYTYGFYLWHVWVIWLAMFICNKKGIDYTQPLTATAFLLIAFFSTFLITLASYYLYERQFLRLKTYFRKG